MKAKITLPSGAVLEVDASPEEIRRLAGEPGYQVTFLPMPATAVCICGQIFWSNGARCGWRENCPVHGFTWRPAAAPGFGAYPVRWIA